ncbi:52 kDa repressor of the inhibitor of the protein kinase-like [Aphis gossypii]|uniref:52 kDa repressor of the inhibitor of the protein kinase-like n=1 Tax=Aphis gossypii TaxID=80765 RepID=UPI002159A000|nr:52 kDa repressor of the inhibitor of the protein kinase-like [Aphis gossypii]
MDLQSVLLCPKTDASAMYYKQKLQLHNFTIYRLNDKDVTLYVWHEGNGSRMKQLTSVKLSNFLCFLRYVDEDSFEIREDFLMFVPVHEVTGSALAKTVLETLSSLGLDLNKLRGEGYDGASAMRGQFRGVQACIKQKLPLAVYTHCSSHNLNLCLSEASKVPSIRNCMGIISEVCAFFHMSAQRTELLKLAITECCPEQRKKKLISLCETRYEKCEKYFGSAEKQTSNVEDNFKELYVQIREFASKNYIKEEVPRTCRLQGFRCNVPYNSEEEYYRRAVYVPYLDDFCSGLNERFETHKKLILSLQCVLPEFCIKSGFSSLDSAYKFYSEDKEDFKEIVQSEFMLWKEKWIKAEIINLPKTAICSIERCNKNLFPNMNTLLKLLAVLPVSVATVERSFSTLRRLMTYLRNTTSETR